MTRSVKLNILRYVISIVVPLCLLQYPLVALCSAVLLLFLNNVADDYSFYLASREVAGNKVSPVSSPINGIITQIERNVPLFSHIKKTDVLTKDEFFELTRIESKFEKKPCAWNHVTIFLDKFSHHVVVNPSDVKSMSRLFVDGRLEEMVVDGKLLADNSGTYLGNQAIVIEYEDMIAVLTLDKYVSKYTIEHYMQGMVGVNIFRGSQCDLYSKRELEHYAHSKGDVVHVGDTIFKMKPFDMICDIQPDLLNAVVTGGWKVAGRAKGIWKANALKTVATFRNWFMFVTVVVGASLSYLSHPMAYVAFSCAYLFVFDRFYRHLMYALMNARGYKPWMSKSYKLIHKVSVLWKNRSSK